MFRDVSITRLDQIGERFCSMFQVGNNHNVQRLWLSAFVTKLLENWMQVPVPLPPPISDSCNSRCTVNPFAFIVESQMLNFVSLTINALDELNILAILRSCSTWLESLASKTMKCGIYYMFDSQILRNLACDCSNRHWDTGRFTKRVTS